VGAVYHANKFVSVFGNYGSSVSQPTFNAINLVTRGLNGPSKGITRDYGLMLDSLTASLPCAATGYETSRKDWDSIVDELGSHGRGGPIKPDCERRIPGGPDHPRPN